MIPRKQQLAGACACLGLAAPAWAQHPLLLREEIVVTATRMPQRLGDALRSVTVITAEDLAASGQLTLAQVLQQLGGLETTSNGGQGTASAVFMRGANATHTLVLVDGVRQQSATSGQTAFEHIPLAQVERIEIVNGPGSSLYGSDAIGGVIQIFTRGHGSTPAIEARVAAGSYGTRSVDAALGSLDYSLAAGALRTDNFNATRPGISFGRFHPDRDGYRNRHFSARLGHRPGAHELGASLAHSDGESQFDNGPDADHRTRQKLSVLSAFSRNPVTAAWESLLRVGASRDDGTSSGDGAPARFRTDNTQATWQNTFTLGEVRLAAGAEHLRQEIDTPLEYAVRARSVASLFAGIDAALGPHALQASVRRDDNSQFGEPTTGTAAYGFRATPALRLRAAYGTAFHAPSFNDLYFPGFGNAALEPERSRSREAGLDLEDATQRFSATAFDNRVSGLITFVFDPATQLFGPQNLASARIRGVELSYAGRFGATHARAKLTLQDPQSLPTGAQLQRRAKRHGSVAVSHGRGAWRFGVEAVASGARFDSADEAPGTRLAGYGVVNLTAAWQASPEWSVDVRWNNVGDKDYELVQGFAVPGANVLATVRWTPRP
jgi:vitamin B12 transporter